RPLRSAKVESSLCEPDHDTLNAILSVIQIFDLKLKSLIDTRLENIHAGPSSGTIIDPHSYFFNDFEESVFKQLPELTLAKDLLLNLGASKVLLSGSGSSIIAYFLSEKRTDDVFREIRACLGDRWFIEKSFLCTD